MHNITVQELADQVAKTRYYQKAAKLAKAILLKTGTKAAAKSAGSAVMHANAQEKVLDTMIEQVQLAGEEVAA